MKQRILLLLLGCMRLCAAQVTETFEGLLLAPAWQGCDSVFTVNTLQQLQLNASTTGEAYLSTPCQTAEGEWTFWCRFQYSPSTSNLMRVYVMSDTAVLSGAVRGYYVQLGGVTGNNDSIVLVRQDGHTRTVIIGGRRATVSKLDNTVGIKVLRDAEGNWQLLSDTTGHRRYVLEGSAADITYTQSDYMGVYAKYTAGNAKRMFWDELYAGELRVDTEGPKVLAVQAINATQLQVLFDEPVDVATALDANNYKVNGGVGLSTAAAWGLNTQTVVLDLGSELTNQPFTLTVRNVQDEWGNTTLEQVHSFVYYVPQPNDIIISEWLPDPSPVVGLPEREFVEVYNRTSMDLCLSGWRLSDGTSTAVLPNDTLRAHSFAIVCAAADTPIFKVFGQTVAVPAVPSLNNSSDQLTLAHANGTLVYACAYDLSWYGDATTSNGGYSIELNSPNQLCKGKYNAGASGDELGGTPGRANSRWTLAADTTRPEVGWYTLSQPNHIRLVFNEPMDTVSLLQATISINQSSVLVTSMLHHDTFDIFLSTPLAKDIIYTLGLEGMRDCSGNGLSKPISLQYLVADTPQLFDVVINEMMSDPDPVVGLPDAEYVELYNRSNRLLSLDGWTLSDGNSTAVLSDVWLYPDSFWVIVAGTKQQLFAGLHNKMGVSNFPSLGNETDTLWLRTPEGKTVHWMSYQSLQHTSTLKRNGGWSLELVDAFNPCGLANNWQSSTHNLGGTPGKRNSVAGRLKDKQAPQLVRVFPVSDRELKLYFNESMDSSSFATHHFRLHPLVVQAASFTMDGYRSVVLLVDGTLHKQTVYSVVVDSVRDCAGNILLSSSMQFGLPEVADSGDVVINELLFNPSTGGSDFVELYNRSERIVDVSKLYMANRNADGDLDNLTPIATEGYLLFPKQYLVCSPDIGWVKQTYGVATVSGWVQTKLPSYNDDVGNCVLTNQLELLDELVYDDKMHLSVLDNTDGVSLERVDFNRPTNDRSNWTSASATAGFATPAARNSQYASTTPSAFIKAEPQVFSPDGDGYNDLVNFSYTCEVGGAVGSFWVYNASGQLVKRLLSNAILGTEGVFTWDGMMDNGERAPMGMYVCYFEVFTTAGNVTTEKLTVVVAAKL